MANSSLISTLFCPKKDHHQLNTLKLRCLGHSSWEILQSMENSKVVAIVTGAISLALAIAYLVVVQFLDMRGEMIPAPLVEVLLFGRSDELVSFLLLARIN
jgi:hypothetical protein